MGKEVTMISRNFQLLRREEEGAKKKLKKNLRSFGRTPEEEGREKEISKRGVWITGPNKIQK